MTTGTVTDVSDGVSEDEIAAVAAAVALLAGRRTVPHAAAPDRPLHAWRLARLAALGRPSSGPQARAAAQAPARG